MAEKGKLKIQCFSGDNYIPVQGCKVTVTSNYGESIEVELTTDSSGLTDIIELDAPAFENSQQPDGGLPYGLCNITVEKSGFQPFVVNGCQIFPTETAYQKCN